MRAGGRGLFLLLWLGLAAPGAAVDATIELEASVDLFPRGEPSSQGWVSITPRLTRRLSPRVLFTAVPVLEADSHGDGDRGRFYDDQDRGVAPALLRFERLSLRFDLGPAKIEVGKQPLTWGRTDAVRATDNLTPRDWTDPLREKRLSPWALRVNVEKERWEGELALVPRYAPSRLPRLGGRWVPLAPLRVANPFFPAVGPAELAVELDFAAAELPRTALDNTQIGVRVGRRGARVEWALSYFRGFDDAAHFDAAAGRPDPAAATVPVILTPRFPDLAVLGGDGVLLAGAWALRAEAGHFRFPEGLDDDFLLYEVDAEWTRGAWRLGLGYAGRTGGERGSAGILPAAVGADGVDAGAVALDLGFVPAAFLSLRRSLLTEWEAGLEAFLGTESSGGLVRLTGSWPLGDGVRLGAEIDLVDGGTGSFFGRWRDNDRLRVFSRLSR